ncbi:MAG: DNA topoisomerase IV subunit B [Muribaculaceae bacterium]
MAEELEINSQEPAANAGSYDELVTLSPLEHIRRRPGMYIGKLGDGSQNDDGIYVLLKETIDNAIDEYAAGFGDTIEVTIEEGAVSIRDYGRGIPLQDVTRAATAMNTSGKFDTQNYQNSVGMNGVGLKATNALSEWCYVQSWRDGMTSHSRFECGEVVEDSNIEAAEDDAKNGTLIRFKPDNTIFVGYAFRDDFVEMMIKNYSFLNTGLTIIYNGKKYRSRNGLSDLVKEYMTNEPLYQPIHLKGDMIECVITHANQYGEEYYSFVNGQHTTQGGTHQSAFREAVSRTIKEFYNKNFEYSDIRSGMVAAISIKVVEPIFESQTKIKLGSTVMYKDGPTVYKYINDFIKKELDNFLHKEPAIAEPMLVKIQESEKERKAIAGVTKQARERAKKVALNNKKLRDCRIHYNDAKGDKRELSSIFITEGLSASGSITKIRDVETQAVFSLRGKPLNSFGMQQKIVYQNEEFNLLQAALNIENGLDDLRYNRVIIATDADVDGMHIRLLMLTFLLQFFPELIKTGHVYILQTPLFRVRDKKGTRRRASAKTAKDSKPDTYYCYSDEERLAAIDAVGENNAEITRFKGLGEISPDEFKDFIGEGMRLDRVTLRKEDAVRDMLEFYMGKNTMERQRFIIDNLIIEEENDITH